MLKCADCDEGQPQWGSLNRGVVLCDECSSLHRHLGRHVTQIKHLTKSRCRKTQMTMLKTLAQSGANKYWEHLLLESSLRSACNIPINDSNQFSIRFRKPTPKDSLHTTKNDFIKEKYLFFGFFKKPRAIVVDDLNQQLHASVRTGFLETSLYLLTLGARPNYQHPTRLTTPLHVAAMYNQPLQVELLLTYGADLLITDGNGDTALQIAYKKSQGSQEPLKWQVLITCLLEAQFEITDSLSYYLCRQTIDHSLSDLNDPSKMINNFLIPKLTLGDNVANSSKQNLDKARGRLQHLPNDAFVDLCLDICDEVDRRDTNDILSSFNQNKELNLFFLPPNPNYSPTRNQGRQKLARLSIQEFRTLCHDVLVQASMRLSPQSHVYQLYSSNQRPQSKKHRSSLPLGTSLDSCVAIEEHDPVYDQVATDGDYAYVMDLHRSQGSPLPININGQKNPLDSKHNFNGAFKNNRISMPIEITGVSSLNVQSLEKAPETDEKSLNSLLIKVDDLTGRNKLLQSKNNDLEKKVKSLESQISQLKDEKTALIAALSSNKGGKHGVVGSKIRSRNHSNNTESSDSCEYQDNLEDVCKLLKATQIPVLSTATTAAVNTSSESTYDTGSDRFSSGPWLRQEILNKGSGQLQSNTSSPISLAHKKSFEPNNKTNLDNLRMLSAQSAIHRNYDNSDSICNTPQRIVLDPKEDPKQCSPLNQSNSNTPTPSNVNQLSDMMKGNMYHLPDYDTPPMDELTAAASSDSASNQVVNGVETIILQIRALLDIANGKKRGDYLHCSRAIQSAVQHLVRLFSSTERRYVNNPVISTQISTALRDLLANSRDLRIRCEKKSNISSRGGVPNEYDTAPVIQHAHEIARAAKMLLTHYQHEEN